MLIRRVLKPTMAIAVVLSYIASMAGVASAGTFSSGQLLVSGSPGVLINFPDSGSPCSALPVQTLTGTLTPTTATFTAFDSTTLWGAIAGSSYLVKLSRTGSTVAPVTGGPSTYTIGNFTMTLRLQIYNTAVPACGMGSLVCTANVRLGMHGSYTSPSSVVLDGSSSYTGGIAVAAPGCPSPFNGLQGQTATLTSPLMVPVL